MATTELPFEYKIDIVALPKGKWGYVIHLQDHSCKSTRKFETSQLAVADARKLLSYML